MGVERERERDTHTHTQRQTDRQNERTRLSAHMNAVKCVAKQRHRHECITECVLMFCVLYI